MKNKIILLSFIVSIFFGCATIAKLAKEESYNYSVADSSVNVVLNVKENRVFAKEIMKEMKFDLKDNKLRMFFDLIYDVNFSMLSDKNFIVYIFGGFPTNILKNVFSKDSEYEKISDSKFLVKESKIYIDFAKPYLLVISNFQDYEKYETKNFFTKYNNQNSFASVCVAGSNFLNMDSKISNLLKNFSFKLDVTPKKEYQFSGDIEFKDRKTATIFNTLFKTLFKTILIKSLGDVGRDIGQTLDFSFSDNFIKIAPITLSKENCKKVFGSSGLLNVSF